MKHSPSIRIAGVNVRQDQHGRLSMNDLHKSAMAQGKATLSQRPANFLKSNPVQAFIEALDSVDATSVASVEASKGGRDQGSFAVELVAIRYAAWIDPEFEVTVYKTFQSVHHQQIELAEGRASREAARLEAPFMTDAVKHQRESAGKAVSVHHFSNEFDLINRIALGMTAKKYRQEHGLAKSEPLRDTLTPCEMKCVEHLQRVNASLIDVGMAFEERKQQLSKIYIQRHARSLIAEIERLEY